MENLRCPCCGRRTVPVARLQRTDPDGRPFLALALWPGIVVVAFVAFLPGTILLAALGVEPRAAAGIVLGSSIALALLGAALRTAMPDRDDGEDPAPVRICSWCERTYAENGLARS